MSLQIAILIVFILFSALFSAAEVAFLALSDAKVDSMIKRKAPRAKQIKKLTNNRRRLLVTILIGNNIVNIAASSLATVVMDRIFDSAVIGITTGVMTLLVLVFGEIIPKSHASNHAKRFAAFSAPFLTFFQWITFPLVITFEWITNQVTGKESAEMISEEELRALTKISYNQGSIEKEEGKMIERLFEFNDITAEDIMTPRVHIVYMQKDVPISKAAEIIRNNPYTRYPVIDESIDQIIGFVHARDVLLSYHSQNESSPVSSILFPIVTVPKQMPIDDIMREFQKRQTHMAVVVDGFGGTDGIATFEDVIEELVGEIVDEHDVSKNLIKRIDKTTIEVSGDTVIRDINSFFNVSIEGNQLDTLAERMLDMLQKIPRKGQSVSIDGVNCKVLTVKKRRIERVIISKNL